MQIRASDALDNDPFPTARNRKFSTIVAEFYVAGEYNFLDYRDKSTRRNWTPYFFGGLGVAYFTAGDAGVQPIIPVGVGFRWYMNKRINLGIDFGIRNTFTDKIDGTSNNPIIVNGLQKLDGFRSDNDKYYFTAIHLTYSLYKIPCPFFYN
jgi:hypothetical protein